ncbi:MAG: hypothetical protein B7733_10965 [Myxococcales bacterium FL481]|nr:MAG: hypothetical protein B7733_10965 [Myxococcales bacterium FL481]
MNLNTKRGLSLLCIGLFSATVPVACDDGGDGDGNGGGGLLGSLREQCGLTCAAEGIVEGNASISGVASIDAFFSSVITVRDTALNASASMKVELEGIAASIGIEGTADMSVSELAAAIEANMGAHIAAYAEGGIEVMYDPAKCEANLDVAVEATADCDVTVDPGMVSASCQGTCEIDVAAQADCMAQGTLKCEGQAPNFDCEGTCTGSCQLEAAAACSGSCNGSCEGTCTACAGGACETDDAGVVTNCAGSCEGSCTGECKLEASAQCEGRCEGSCEYTPASGSCEANATAKCEASAEANVDCKGSCEGEVVPPSASAECEAAVEAKASASVECTPPSLRVDFQFRSDLDANAKAEFKAWLENFKARFAAIVAINAKLVGPSVEGDGGLQLAITNLGSAAGDAVNGAVTAAADAAASGDLKVIVGLECASKELGNVGTALGAATSELQASASAFVTVAGSVSARRTR